MGASGISLRVSGDGDREALHSAIWEATQRFIANYVGSEWPEYGRAWDYLSEEAWDGWGVDGDGLHWWFSSWGGCASVMMGAWLHWLELAFAANHNRLTGLAEDHGLTIETKPSVLS